MRFLRRQRGAVSPVEKARALIEARRRNPVLKEHESIEVSRLMREVASSNIPLHEKKRLVRGLKNILGLHAVAAEDRLAFVEWAKSRNNGKTPRGIKALVLEAKWIFGGKYY